MITQAHVDAMRTVIEYWLFPTLLERCLLDDILTHLQALLAPVPSQVLLGRPHPPDWGESFESWLKDYDHLNDDDCQSDQ